MVYVSLIVFQLLLVEALARPASQPQIHFDSLGPASDEPNPGVLGSKSIAIVGGGSAGLAILDTLLQYKAAHRTIWTISLFEQRHDVGGIWLPNKHRTEYPEIPMTPLYPHLRTNTPVPSMTYPNHTFPPGTPLFPPAHHIEEYHRNYARRHGLYSYIKLNHTITSTQWIGNATSGHWSLSYTTTASSTPQFGRFDHLVVAAGNNHFPHMPVWPGQDLWLAHGKHRQITHSVWFQLAEEYKGMKVLLVGSRASGVDIATQLASFCSEVYISTRSELERETDSRVVVRPEIARFTKDTVVFKDGTTFEADVVMLCTGYDLRFPFLEANGTLSVDPGSSSLSTGLKTNLRYIYPLHDHIFSLDPSYPVTALSFVGLPIFVSNCPSDIAQSIYLTHVLANPDILPNRQRLLQRLSEQHEYLRKQGQNPYYVGHRLLGTYSFDYQDDLVEYLKTKGVIPQDDIKFVENWRRELSTMKYLRRGWMRVERLGLVDEWLAGVYTEGEWVSMMRSLNAWEEEQEHLEAGY